MAHHKHDNDIRMIERDLEETRARTESTIQALQDKLQPRAVLDEASRFFKGTDSGAYAEDVTRNALAQARENPLPALLIGVGAALLATKRPGRPRYIEDESGVTIRDGVIGNSSEYDYDYAMQTEDELSSLYDAEYEDTHRVIGANETIERTYTRLDQEDDDAYQNRLYEARGKAFEIQRSSDEDDKTFRKRIDERLQGAKAKAGEYRQKADGYRKRQADRASGLYHKAGERTSAAYAGGKAKAGAFYEGSKDRAGNIYEGSRDRAGNLVEGARDQAGQLSDNAQYAARRGAQKTANFYDDKPLVVAVAAVAAGAIAGSMFGTTRQERKYLGPVGDEVNDAAQRLNEQANRKVAEYAHKVEDIAEAASGKVDEVAAKVPTGKSGGASDDTSESYAASTAKETSGATGSTKTTS